MNSALRGTLAAIAACGPMVAQAAQPLSVEAALSSERVSGGRTDWRGAEVTALWRDSAAWNASAVLRRTERFGLSDLQAEAGASIPLGARWRVETELAESETSRVLPHWRWRSRAWLLDAMGWNLAAGLGRTLYRSGGASSGSSVVEFQVERYVGAFRGAWLGSVTRLDAGGTSSSQQWRLNWYPTDVANVGVVLAVGRELENIPGIGVVSSQVRAAAITATWQLAPRWGVNAGVSDHRQGDLYRRTGLRLGLQHQF
jgi:YaiO family outer membrane protein